MNKNPKNSTEDPKQAYKNKLEKYQLEQKDLEATSGRFSWARIVAFLLILFIAWLSLVENQLAPLWLLLTFALLLVLMLLHAQVSKRLKRAQRAETFYIKRLDHLAGRWSGQGNQGDRYCDPDHSYSADLDTFGENSLFEFLCDARTRLGEDTLAEWLSSGVDLDTIKSRQEAVEELRHHLEFREEIALLDEVSDDELDQNGLQGWIEKANPISGWQRSIATVLGILAVLSIILWALGYGTILLMLVIVLEVLFYSTSYQKIRAIALEAEQANSTLVIVSQMLELIEQKNFKAPLLKQLSAKLQSNAQPPSQQIDKLQELISQLNQCTLNQMIIVPAFLLGLPIHAAHRLEQWRKQIGSEIPQWLDVVGQIEALNSLARYAFDNPNNTFPELVAESEPPCFDAFELSHPLIPEQERVANDLSINSQQQLIMVSGSNMSGKSTLLRTIGVNVVLACCGAPVQAKHLKTSRFVIGSAMRASDSLKQGASFFYAVISRIKCVVDLAKQPIPLLFLLDEILQGTNSHDRLIGAKAIIYQLINHNAVGLVTTHDLALTEIVDSLSERAINIHFKDHIENDQISFDYKIRPGVIQKSNGLDLMKMIGLDITSDLTKIN